MNVTKEVAHIIEAAFAIAKEHQCEYLTPEILLYAMCEDYIFCSAFRRCGGNVEQLEDDLIQYAMEYLTVDESVEPELSHSSVTVFTYAQIQAKNSGKDVIELPHLVHSIWQMKDCYASYYMKRQGIEYTDFMQELLSLHNETMIVNTQEEEKKTTEQTEKEFELYAPCMNDQCKDRNPLIGREAELERTIQILSRKDKNNPLHIGEPGVGKTAITYGLAERINRGKVPDGLKEAKIYALDLAGILSGTKYRGELEKRLKKVLEDLSKQSCPIVYIDEIHNLTGAGAVGESSFDIANLLKPYLSDGSIRFIGATTFEEYKKYFEKNKSLARRFQNIEIQEASIEESITILKGLKRKYEKYHGVTYGKGVIEYAVEMSAKYVNERYLPDKAIDLMDEAGAYRKIHPLKQKKQSVGKDVIQEILNKTCQIPLETVKKEEEDALSTLKERILSKIYGQDEAVEQVVNAIKYARAGLLEDQKPLSSFLFAGPTGVGKTEIAKTLAKELGIKLLRFDMSEYGEKHAIAKLIGSPAGYVGYEEGGQLTEAIRKNPSCVLLLDEIEKAHHDIYNVLLQVMDYATLTDNQGRKADFRNVIIILTSNAGASQIGKAGIGFQKRDVTADVIREEVKRIFQPEFRNRLNRIVVFHHMDDAMAMKIAQKKLNELGEILLGKKVEFSYSKEAVTLLKRKGSNREFGAREMDRVIQNEIKTLLVDDLLFGKLRKGGTCYLDCQDETFVCKNHKK